jgi:hypothetical protein
MNTAKKASASIIEDESVSTQAAEPEKSDAPKGVNEELGMTAVADRSAKAQAVAGVETETVRMVNADGNEADVNAADVAIHERAGWKRQEE